MGWDLIHFQIVKKEWRRGEMAFLYLFYAWYLGEKFLARMEIASWFCFAELTKYMGTRDPLSTSDGGFFSLIRL
jgi:hypothetical protein